jgi:hypothetical protein
MGAVVADYKDFAAAKSAAPARQTRDTLIDWGRVGDALRSTGQRVGDAALDAALNRPAPPAPPAPVIVRDSSSGSGTTMAWLLGLAVAGLALAAVLKK